eukprot:2418892-Pyramimonas_sp.AAC.1
MWYSCESRSNRFIRQRAQGKGADKVKGWWCGRGALTDYCPSLGMCVDIRRRVIRAHYYANGSCCCQGPPEFSGVLYL